MGSVHSSPFCPLTCLSPYLPVPCPSPYQEAVGLGSRRFPVPIPALLPTNCVTLGRSFHLQGSSSTHIKSFPVPVTRCTSKRQSHGALHSGLPIITGQGRARHSQFTDWEDEAIHTSSPRLRSGQRGTGRAKNRPRSPVPSSCSALTTLGQRIHFVSQHVILSIYGNYGKAQLRERPHSHQHSP